MSLWVYLSYTSRSVNLPTPNLSIPYSCNPSFELLNSSSSEQAQIFQFKLYSLLIPIIDQHHSISTCIHNHNDDSYYYRSSEDANYIILVDSLTSTAVVYLPRRVHGRIVVILRVVFRERTEQHCYSRRWQTNSTVRCNNLCVNIHRAISQSSNQIKPFSVPIICRA